MIWLVVLVLAGVGFAVAVLALNLPRSAFTIMGAALLFALTGYAWQGSPDLASAPRAATAGEKPRSTSLIDIRREMFGGIVQPSRNVGISDGFARRGQYQDAAGFLKNALEENPDDTEAWVALGNALVMHAEGRMTPPARYAFEQARATNGDQPAPAFFEGLAYLAEGKMIETRDLWAEALDKAPADAGYRPWLENQLRGLDGFMEGMEAAMRSRPAPGQP